MRNWTNSRGSCLEYILIRDKALSKVKGWIFGNTKIGPALSKYNTSWTRNSRTNICDKRLRNIVHDYKHILTDIERIVDNCVNDATHAYELTMQHWAHCTQSVVASSDVFTSHSTWLKLLALIFHCHPIHGHAHCCLSVLFLLTF